uniref:Protein Gawky n=1 Tax=Syphacia muris TaxID=451379 RepID=A0A0N5AB40_9BILA
MWGVDDKAGTMAMNPWNNVAQAPVWTDMGRGNGGQPTFNSARVPDSRATRTWFDHQMQAAVGQWNPPPSIQSQWSLPPNQHGVWPLQQWGATANSPNGTYAEQTKKNMLPIRGQAINSRYDQQPQAWNNLKVDQQTPWDTGSGPSMHVDQKGEWGGAAGVTPAAGTRWGGNAQWTPGPHAAGAPDWTQHHRHDPTGTGHWANAMQPHPTAMVPTGVAGGSWGQPQPPLSTPNDQYDPNPQTPGPWVAPQPAEMNNDMMWHDPNPKQKKVQRDTGTSVWGDPNAQQVEIRRWKDAEQEDYSHIPCAAPSGGDWSNIPVSSGPISTNTSPPSVTASGWTDSQPAHPMNAVNDNNDRWNGSQQTSGWGDLVKPLNTAAAASGVENSIIDTIRPSESGVVGHSALTQQIADQLKIAVSKGLIDVSLIKQQLPQSGLIILNSILQKVQKMEQAQQEYTQLMRNMNTSSNAAQKMETERVAMEIQTLHTEIMQLRNNLNEPLMKVRYPAQVNGVISMPSDGQSRLNQWRQANSGSSTTSNVNGANGSTGTTSSNSTGGSNSVVAAAAAVAAVAAGANNNNSSEKMIASSTSDNNVSALAAATGNLTLDDKVDWKRGMLDWSPPSGTNTAERSITDAGSNLEKEVINDKSQTNKLQGNNSTPSPKIDDGPQEFVPGKKWEWRDPNKVAEDPNATPGNCKPNPLLSTSSSNANFQMSYGQNVPQGTLPNETSTSKAPFMGWNNVPYNCEMYGRNRPVSNAGQQQFQRMQSGHGQPSGFSRSMSSPGQQHFQNLRWILIQSHGQSEQQIQMLAQKAGKLVQYFCPPAGGAFWGLKFMEPAEAVVERMKAEVPF